MYLVSLKLFRWYSLRLYFYQKMLEEYFPAIANSFFFLSKQYWRQHISWESDSCLSRIFVHLHQFFLHFATAEPAANVCVAHEALYKDPSVYITKTVWNRSCKSCPRKIRPISAEPLAVTCGTLRFRGILVEKHWLTQLTFWWCLINSLN